MALSTEQKRILALKNYKRVVFGGGQAIDGTRPGFKAAADATFDWIELPAVQASFNGDLPTEYKGYPSSNITAKKALLAATLLADIGWVL